MKHSLVYFARPMSHYGNPVDARRGYAIECELGPLLDPGSPAVCAGRQHGEMLGDDPLVQRLADLGSPSARTEVERAGPPTPRKNIDIIPF